MKKTIILDIDGTLIDTKKIHVKSLYMAIKKYRSISVSEIINLSMPNLLDEIEFFIHEEEQKNVLRDYILIFKKELENLSATKKNNKLIEVMDQLISLDYIFIAYTGRDYETSKSILKFLELEKQICLCYACDNKPVRKPNILSIDYIRNDLIDIYNDEEILFERYIGDSEFDRELSGIFGIKYHNVSKVLEDVIFELKHIAIEEEKLEFL